jgi:ATP/maltotriose-dependent transcriptional regulator MalT
MVLAEQDVPELVRALTPLLVKALDRDRVGSTAIELRINADHGDVRIRVEVGAPSGAAGGEGAPLTLSTAPLTPAERRVLPYLATNLAYPEIAEQLYVSRHTVKTQVISIYRKLGVSCRRDAVEEARRLGLIGRLALLEPAL